MLLLDGGLGLVLFALWLLCIIDVVTTPEGRCRNLPKLLWLLIVIILPEIGSLAWLIAGHNWNRVPAHVGDRGGRGAPTARSRATNPDDDEEFIASLRIRAEEQRRRAREAQRQDPDEPPAPQPPAPQPPA